MGAIVTEVRIDSRAAATLHMWCTRHGYAGSSVSTAIRVAAETLAAMLPIEEQFTTYGESAAYLKRNMKSLNRRAKSGMTESLKKALAEEGMTEELEVIGPSAHFQRRPGHRHVITETPEELAAIGRRIMQNMSHKATQGERVSDENKPISADEFAEEEAARRRAEKAAFMSVMSAATAAAMRSSGASALDNTATSGDSSGEGGENG